MNGFMKSIDHGMQRFLDWVKDGLENVEYWHAIAYAIFSALCVSMATNGYLAAKSIDPVSITGLFYFVMFFTQMLVMAIHISPDSQFLFKIVVVSIVSYALGWQILAMNESTKDFQPLATNGFMTFLFFGGALGTFIYAFSGDNDLQQKQSNENRELKAQLDRLQKIIAEQGIEVDSENAGDSSFIPYSD